MNVGKIQNLYFGLYKAGKMRMISRYNHNVARGYLNNAEILTEEQKQAAKDFYEPYAKFDPVFHAFFTEKTGTFYPHWMPADIYINYIDEYLNNREAAKVLDNKCLYSRLFPGIPQIPTIISRKGGLWYNGEDQLVSYESAMETLREEDAAFVKAATRSCGGDGVRFICAEYGDLGEQLAQAVLSMPGDIVVQKPFRQHPVFAALNGSSVNTLRFISRLSEEGVKIYSAIVRMGLDGAKIDNASAGGVFCGVREDGTLKEIAYRLSGETFKEHPTSGIVFDGYQLAGLDSARALIEKAHPMVPHFRLVSWDIVIDEQGEAYMLEANLARTGNESLQLANGPLFGEDTVAILDEVFGKKKG